MSGSLRITLLFMLLSGVGSWLLGPGPLGPDGSGASASAVLGGHPYPLHPWLIRLLGGEARLLSWLASAGVVLIAGRLAESLGGEPWRASLLTASGALLMGLSVSAGGDAAACCLALGGWLALLRQRALLGGLLAGASLWVKPSSLPLVLVCLLAPGASLSRRERFFFILGISMLALPALSGPLAPLIWPRPGQGLLGSWWLSSGGAPPSISELPAWCLGGLRVLSRLPWWTGLPWAAAALVLSLFSARWSAEGRLTVAFTLLIGATTACVIGDRLEPRYLASLWPALGILLSPWPRVTWLAPLTGLFSLSWLLSYAELRAHEEGLTPRAELSSPLVMDLRPEFMAGGVCGGGSLREIAQTWVEELPAGASVWVPPLRDGREGELLWPLRAQRPDLKLSILHPGCCPQGACLERVQEALPEALIWPGDLDHCRTPTGVEGWPAWPDAQGQSFVALRGAPGARDPCLGQR